MAVERLDDTSTQPEILSSRTNHGSNKKIDYLSTELQAGADRAVYPDRLVRIRFRLRPTASTDVIESRML
ncbi:MAG: hypothetical protein MZV70_50760 [Desulfobacterales bacterium]|nr:hypothetical protein [Desulfobacterales bacterium]